MGKKIIQAIIAAIMLAALAGCDEAMTAAPAGPRTPTAAPATTANGIVGEPYLIAIVSDKTATNREQTVTRQRVNNVIQHGQRIDRTISFPSDFEYEQVDTIQEWSYQFPHSGITREVLERGAIIPWVSIDDGASWIAGTFDFYTFTMRIAASTGRLTVFISTWHHERTQEAAADLVKRRLTENRILIRLYVILTTGTQADN